MLGRSKNIFIGDDVDVQCSRSPFVQTNPAVEIFYSSNHLEKFLWSQLGGNLDYPV